jgi:hypothetical protein
MATISQLPAQLTLRKFRGDDLVVSLDFDVDLTGYTFAADIYTLSAVTGNLGTVVTAAVDVGSFAVGVVSYPLGEITLTLSDSASDALDPGSYRWFFRWTSPTGDTRTVLNGSLEVVDDISQASGVDTDGVEATISVANTLTSSGLPVAAGAAGLLNEVLWS